MAANKIARNAKYPTKTRMNLAQREKSDITPKKAALPTAILAVLIALFAKFGVYDQISRATQVEQETSAENAQLSALQTQLSGYSDVVEQYKVYSYGYMTDDEKAIVDPVDAIDIIEDEIMPEATVSSIIVADNKASVTFSGMTLAQVGTLQANLKTLPMVSDVSVYTAGTTRDETTGSEKVVDASMVITLQKVNAATVTSNTGPATAAQTASSTSSTTTTASTTAATTSSQTSESTTSQTEGGAA